MNFVGKGDLQELGHNGRITSFDICKAICIISVIAGHICQRYQIKLGMQFFYTYHIQLMLLISGYFLNVKRTLKQFINNRARRLLLPYWICCGFIISEKTLLNLFKEHNLLEALKTVFKWLYISAYGNGNGMGTIYLGLNRSISTSDEVGMLWFLLALFWGGCIVRILYKYKHSFCLVIIVFMTGMLSSKLFWIPFGIQNGMCAALWLYMGLLIRNRLLLQKILTIKKQWIILVVAIWILSIFLGETHLYANYFRLGFFDIIATFCGSLIVFILSDKISNMRFRGKNTLCWVGCNTMPIYAIHSIESKTLCVNVVWNKIFHLEYIAAMVSWISLIVICIVGTVIMGKSGKFSKIFGIKHMTNIE